ncbi:MAG: carboxyl transferase domain-containing protein [Leptospirales bacterium]
MLKKIEDSLENLKIINSRYAEIRTKVSKRTHKLQKVLVANRGEIAKRFFLSLREEGIPSVAIVTDVDLGQSWYEQADEVVVIGEVRNYTNISIVIAAALLVKANAIYPGYGFLSEEATFVEAIRDASKEYKHEMMFMGPDASIMHKVGDKLAARKLAKEQGVPLFEGSEALPDGSEALIAADKIGYPVIVKLTSGGGGKGMMPVHSESGLYLAIEYCQRMGRQLYNSDVFYLEKFIERPVHMEVQIFNGTAIGIRKCAVQRRNQKVVEESGEGFLDSHTILSMLAAAENMADISGYSAGAGAGTVEFLFDPDSAKFGFLEMNARLQVEHPVTDQSVGIDLAKWQILYFDGRDNEIPYQLALKRRFVEKLHSIEARIYAEDPENDYAPAPGKIQELELPTFNGIRSDFGFKKGDLILPHYDPMIGKVIVEGATRAEAITRLERALSELYIKGVLTNVNQLLKIVRHSEFKTGNYTNRLLQDHRSLESGEPDEKEGLLAAVFGALAENARYIKEGTTQAFISGDLENSIHALRLRRLPISYNVKLYNQDYEIELLQTSLAVYYVSVNGEYLGEVEQLPRLEGNDDYLVRFGVQYYPIRIDRKPSFSVLRMQDDEGKIHYYKLNIVAQGAGDKVDPEGMMRAPFQSTFVAFAKDENLKRDRLSEGSIVKKGDPILIIAAMKMETTLFAPISGKVSYLVEDGDLSKLEVGKTPDGLVIGKSLVEGEILYTIEPELDSKAEEKEAAKPVARKSPGNHPLDLLYEDSIFERVNKKPTEVIPVVLMLAASHFQGFLPDDKIISRVSEVLGKIDPKSFAKCDSEILQTKIGEIIAFYTNVKKIFSPTLDTNLSFFGELNRFVSQWGDDTAPPSYAFRMTLNQLFKAYGILDWNIKSSSDSSTVKLAFFNILRAHGACTGFPDVIRSLVEIISYVKNPSKRIVSLLKGLVLQEQSERDDSLAVYTARLIRDLDGPQISRDIIPIISRKYIPEFRQHMTEIYHTFPGHKPDELEAKISASLKTPESDLIGDGLPEWFHLELSERTEKLSKSIKLKRLYSPFKEVVIYLAENKKNKKKRYFALSYVAKVDLEKDERGKVISSESTERACIHTTQVVRAYHQMKPLDENWVEVFACSNSIPMDIGSLDTGVLSYHGLARTGLTILRFFTDVAITRTTVHIDAENPYDKQVRRKSILLNRHKGQLKLDFLIDRDESNPYFDGEPNPREQRLFDREKWPIDIWVKESFDPGTSTEITIASIDERQWINPKTDKEEIKPVGGKIFIGHLNKTPALYYLKDSRIAGGASGNLEGLKYAAATYIAYRKNIPLYVWNDGAGANIKEGVVSLNRAAQGFMMNALLGGRASEEVFNRYTENSADPELSKLFQEVDRLESVHAIESGTGYFVTGVGIGSSTGLDVYGSSQMAVQLMVDSRESYRVLTGSNVIKSVTGEDLTNYEIGGARVMGKWTGTVDLIAQNKLHLLNQIRSIQKVFVDQRMLSSIQRVEESTKDSNSVDTPDVLNYQIIRRNSDEGYFLPMKEEFFGSGSTLGGFVRLGGRTTLVMGPRTNFGIRSFASITKAKELLVIAHKTGANQILLYGENWYHETVLEDDLAIRARTDFLRLLNKRQGIRVHIITHRDGLHRVTMNSSADALIYVNKDEISTRDYEVIRKTATFIVDTIEEAFDISHKIFNLLDPVGKVKVEKPNAAPTLPEDTSLPFDMVANIIERTVDKDSYIEFYSKMNNPTQGPSLITGLARLNGETVGIIADQPVIMGGAPDAPGTEKFRFFTEFLEKNSIPLLMLSNAPGFVPGTKQERLRIQQIGAESLDVNVLSQIPVVSVVLNQNFGGRQIHSFSKDLRPGIVYIAMKKAVIAVMGASASFDLFMGPKYQELLSGGKTKEANELKKKYVEEYNNKAAASNDAYKTGVLDWVMDDLKELRDHLMKGLVEAKRRVNEIFKSRFAGMKEEEKDEVAVRRILELKNVAYEITDKGEIKLQESGKIVSKKLILDSLNSIDI